MDGAAGRAKLATEFELQGLHRALRLSGARPGDRIRIGERETALWEYPLTITAVMGEDDGMRDYPYVLTDPLSVHDPDENIGRAEALASKVVEMLVSEPARAGS